MQAGVLSPGKGGAGPPRHDVHGILANAGSPQPIRDSCEERITPGSGWGDHEEARQTPNGANAVRPIFRSPKKRRADEGSVLDFPIGDIAQVVEVVIDEALATPLNSIQCAREELKDWIAQSQIQMTKMMNEMMEMIQGKAEKREEILLQKLLEQSSKTVPRCLKCSNKAVSDPQQARSETQSTSQPKEVPSQTWAARLSGTTQKTNEWTTVSGRRKTPAAKKTPKKHPMDQRRVLLLRQVPIEQDRAQQTDPRDVMLAVNKALAQGGTDVSTRLAGLRYTRRGHLSGLTSEYASADDMLEHAVVVTAAARKLDPAVVKLEKTEKWRKLRVHGVSLDRYLGDGGLDLAKEEIELMTGESLPYAPRWIRAEGLEERYHSEEVTRSTLVVTVKSKNAADTIMAKGLSFGGRRHEAEKFWTKGEGGICMQCCGHDHFGKCKEAAKCYVCAGEHEGTEHRCQVKGCEKKSAPCEHHAAKCVNCGGKHMATSKGCPEKWQQRQRKRAEATEGQSPLQKAPEEAICSDITEGHARNSGHPDRPSEPRSTPSLPKTPVVNPPAPEAGWNGESLAFEMDIGSDVESSSPTPRQRRTTPMTISDDSATT
ncbi:hypothetical protein KC331_g1892 [Hortaea werneckii]|nr:hypothetical protein KC339_g15443 [Hortaea werneckii]KAI7220695.1 hypothetical protein KC365_g11935 [Hortaea werneckii]KAI7552430.1 hypothetical protein KC331_g1892 [Hortaea werneckii]KAI7720810.1 hypothetical protein KC353_g1873 [Hortaea werneckii]